MYKLVKKYIKKKEVQSLMILLLAVMVSISLVQSPKKNNTPNNENSSGTSDSILSYTTKDSKIFSNNSDSLINNLEGQDNLTDQFVNEYIKALSRKNPEGPEEIGGEKIFEPPSLGSIQIEGSEFEKMANEIFKINRYSQKDIEVTENNSYQRQLLYIKKIEEVSGNNFGEIPVTETDAVNEWLTEQSTENLGKFRKAASNQVDDLLEIEVPSNWLSIHIQVLNLLKKKIIAFDAMINSEKDPMKSIIAFRKYAEFANESFSISSLVYQRTQELENNF